MMDGGDLTYVLFLKIASLANKSFRRQCAKVAENCNLNLAIKLLGLWETKKANPLGKSRGSETLIFAICGFAETRKWATVKA